MGALQSSYREGLCYGIVRGFAKPLQTPIERSFTMRALLYLGQQYATQGICSSFHCTKIDYFLIRNALQLS